MKRLIFPPLLLCLACGGGDGDSLSDVVGVYEVTAHTVNDTACDSEGDAVTDYSHFKMTEGSLLGASYVSFGECTSADPSTCSDQGLLAAFTEVDGELVSKVSASSGGGAQPCLLSYSRAVLTFDGAELRIERRLYNEEDDTLSEAECDPDTADARGASMPCERLEVIVGVPVG